MGLRAASSLIMARRVGVKQSSDLFHPGTAGGKLKTTSRVNKKQTLKRSGDAASSTAATPIRSAHESKRTSSSTTALRTQVWPDCKSIWTGPCIEDLIPTSGENLKGEKYAYDFEKKSSSTGKELVCHRTASTDIDEKFSLIPGNIRLQQKKHQQFRLSFMLLLLIVVLMYIFFQQWRIWKLEMANRNLVSSLIYSNDELEHAERKHHNFVETVQRKSNTLKAEINNLKKEIASFSVEKQKLLQDHSLASEKINQLEKKLQQLRKKTFVDASLINGMRRKEDKMKRNFNDLEKEFHSVLFNNSLLEKNICSHENKKKMLIEKNSNLMLQVNKMKNNSDELKKQLDCATNEKVEIIQKAKMLEDLIDDERKKFIIVRKKLENVNRLKNIQISNLMNQFENLQKKLKHKRKRS